MDDLTYLEFKDLKKHISDLDKKIDILLKKISSIQGFFEILPKCRGWCDNCGVLSGSMSYIYKTWLCENCLKKEIGK